VAHHPRAGSRETVGGDDAVGGQADGREPVGGAAEEQAKGPPRRERFAQAGGVDDFVQQGIGEGLDARVHTFQV